MIKLLVYKKNRNFLRLWVSQLISQFGDRIHQLALVGLVAERASGSTMDLAKLMSFTILPVFIIQPFAGVFVDRWDQKTTLFVCDCLRGVLVLTIPFLFFFGESMVPIYVIVFLAFCCSRFYFPAKMSILPSLVDKNSLIAANSLVSTTGMIAFVGGCALGGFLIDHFGARNGFIIDAATFFLSGLLIFSMDLSKRLRVNRGELLKTGKEIVGPLRKSVWGEIREGFHYIVEHREIRSIINIVFTLMASAGAVYVVLIVFIQESFQSVTKDLGILAVCLGCGLFVGAMVYGKWGKRVAWHKTIFSSLFLGGVMLIIFAVIVWYYPNIMIAMFLSFFWGMVVGPIFIASNTVVHLVSDEHMRGKVFSALEIVIHFAFLIAMFISSWVSERMSERFVLISVGVIVTCVGAFGFLKKRISTVAFDGSNMA